MQLLGKSFGSFRKVRLNYQSAVISLALISALMLGSSVSYAQNVASKIVPVITFLLDGDGCVIRMITPGDVIFDSIEAGCPVVGEPGETKQYFSFTHAGGPLHVDLLNDISSNFDPFLSLRLGLTRDGPPLAASDDDHEDALSSQMRFVNLAAGTYTLEVSDAFSSISGSFNLSVYSDIVTAKATGRLNDTGIAIAGTSETTNSSLCNGSGVYANQDCAFGRDNDMVLGRIFSQNDNDGQDGFSFLRVSSTGLPLRSLDENGDAFPPDHACVKDNVTGLMWEVKTDDDGLHDKDHTYTWYNTNNAENAGANGNLGSATCLAGVTNCNTEDYVDAVNTAGLCNYNDWRMPTVSELQSLLNYSNIFSVSNNTLDTNFFPEAQKSLFWSTSPLSFNAGFAWTLDFNRGVSNGTSRSVSNPIRLVRSG